MINRHEAFIGIAALALAAPEVARCQEVGETAALRAEPAQAEMDENPDQAPDHSRTVASGTFVDIQLSPSKPQWDQLVSVEPGERVEIRILAHHEAFDPFVVVRNAVGELIRYDDDSFGDLNPIVLLDGGDAGREYALTVSDLSGALDSVVSFSLMSVTIQGVNSPAIADPAKLQDGDSYSGTHLAGGSPLFTFKLDAGQRAEISALMSFADGREESGYEPSLQLFSGSDPRQSVITQDVYGSAGEAKMFVSAQEDMQYTIALTTSYTGLAPYNVSFNLVPEMVQGRDFAANIGIEPIVSNFRFESQDQEIPTAEFGLDEGIIDLLLTSNGTLQLEVTSQDRDFLPILSFGFGSGSEFLLTDQVLAEAPFTSAQLNVTFDGSQNNAASLRNLRVKVSSLGASNEDYVLRARVVDQ